MRRQKNPPVRKKDNYFPKDWEKNGRTTSKKRKTSLRQTGGFLNRYDFAYTAREVVNQAGKVAPKLINQATGEIKEIAQQRIDQVIRSGGQKLNELHQKS